MTREELIANLIREAHNEVNRHNCQFSTDADSQLRELVTAGVDRMTDAERNNGLKIAEAQRNMRFLCQKLNIRATGKMMEILKKSGQMIKMMI